MITNIPLLTTPLETDLLAQTAPREGADHQIKVTCPFHDLYGLGEEASDLLIASLICGEEDAITVTEVTPVALHGDDLTLLVTFEIS